MSIHTSTDPARPQLHPVVNGAVTGLLTAMPLTALIVAIAGTPWRHARTRYARTPSAPWRTNPARPDPLEATS